MGKHKWTGSSLMNTREQKKYNKYTKSLTKKIEALKTLGLEIVSREVDNDDITYKYLTGFCREIICVKLRHGQDTIIVPLQYYWGNFYISYRNHGGMGLFNLFRDKVEYNHLFTKENN